MKKGAVKASGIISIIMYLLLLVVGVFMIANVFDIEFLTKLINSNNIISCIFSIIYLIFVGFPVLLLNKFLPDIDSVLLQKIITIVFVVFCVYMIIWGIKEITLGKKDDYEFARCKKTCSFMNFIKFMVFLYFVAVIVCNFVLEELNLISSTFEVIIDVPYIFVITTAVLALLAFLTFVLATANMFKAARIIKNGKLETGNENSENYQSDNNNYGSNLDGSYQNYNGNNLNNGQPQYSSSQMQANMPPMPGYQPHYNQPSVQAQFNPQVQKKEEQQASQIVPGQNGIPINITQKGIQDLERLERLRQSGAITEGNYIVMRTKICNSNLS